MIKFSTGYHAIERLVKSSPPLLSETKVGDEFR